MATPDDAAGGMAGPRAKRRPAGMPEAARLDTFIDAEADDVIRVDIARARGTLAAWWEEASRWLAAHPDARAEITQAMRATLGDRRRRY